MDTFLGYVPLFVEHCEAAAAEIDVKRRWPGEQERRLSFCFGELAELHATLEVAYAPSVVPTDTPHRAHHIFDHVGAGQRAPQLLGQPKPHDGEDLVDAFQDRAGDPGPVSFETLGQVAEQLFGLVGVVQLPGLSQHAIAAQGEQRRSAFFNIGRDNSSVTDWRDFARKIAAMRPGTATALGVFRNGHEERITVTLGEQPRNAAVKKPEKQRTQTEVPVLGLTVVAANTIACAGNKGIVITSVIPTSVAAMGGLQEGDVILDVGGNVVNSAEDINKTVEEARGQSKRAICSA